MKTQEEKFVLKDVPAIERRFGRDVVELFVDLRGYHANGEMGGEWGESYPRATLHLAVTSVEKTKRLPHRLGPAFQVCGRVVKWNSRRFRKPREFKGVLLPNSAELEITAQI